MKLSIRDMGNEKGIIFPASLLKQVGLKNEAEAAVEEGKLVLSKPRCQVRQGWSESAKALAEGNGDKLVWPEFANADDVDWQW